MSCKINILITYIFAIFHNLNVIQGEWVEIPQFSDEAKIYRLPFIKNDHGEKYFVTNSDSSPMQSFANVSTFNHGFRRITIHQQSGFVDQSRKPNFNNENTSPTAVITEKPYKFENSDASSVQRPVKTEDHLVETDFEDEATTIEEDNEQVTSSTNFSDEKIVVDNDDGDQSAIPTRPEEEDDNPKPDDIPEGSFLAYMPMELFNKVHATLKTQPSTVKGKLSFLKRFEITLLAEIEKRLVPVINPVRRKRESRGDHGWDDNDDAIGFPSLEGALIAISFLTFAVYLVQLVMMLFRNLGNPINAINPTNPVLPTVLLNRNKRSDDEFTEHTARILRYIDKYAESQSNIN